MTLSYPWTFEHERERLRFLHYLRRKRRRLDPTLISLAVLVWTLMQSGQKGLAAIALGLLIGRAYLVYYSPFWMDKLKFPESKDEITWPIQTLTLGESSVETQRHQTSTILPWENATELAETETLFFLCDDDGGAIGIPKSAFENDEAKSAFIQRVEAGLKAGAETRTSTSSTLPLGR